MKKIFKILLTLLVTFNLWGCGSKSEENYLYIDGSKDIEYKTLLEDKVIDTKYYKIELLETPKIQNTLPEVSNPVRFMEARLVASPVKIRITNKTDKTLYLPSIYCSIEYTGYPAYYDEKESFYDEITHTNVITGWKLSVRNFEGSESDGMYLNFPKETAVDQKNDEHRPREYKGEIKLKPKQSVESIDLDLFPGFHYDQKDLIPIEQSYTYSFYIERLQTNDSKLSNITLTFNMD